MSLWRQITCGVRVLTHRSAVDDDVDDEVRHYFEETTSALVTPGLSPADARRAARLELCTMAALSEDVRAYVSPRPAARPARQRRRAAGGARQRIAGQ
jgi:hypothetical protein